MATPPSDDTIMLFKLLEDPDKWYPYYEIKTKIAEKVPPGRAIRKYKQRLKESRDMRGAPPISEVVRSDAEQIRLGAMACAQVALTSWKGKGIMVRGEGSYKEIKRKPGFNSWGIGVFDQPGGEAQDPGKDVEGYTEVPPSDSEPSEPRRETGESVSESPAEVPVVVSGPVAGPEPAGLEPAGPEPVVPETEPVALEPVGPEPIRLIEPADVFFAADDPIPEPAGMVSPPEGEEPSVDPGPVPDASSHMVSIYEVETCPECGMGMTDKAIHEEWHEQLRRVTASSGSAFVDPVALRTLVEDVVRQGLSRFQAGMQDWLEERFAEVERQIRRVEKTSRSDRSWGE